MIEKYMKREYCLERLNLLYCSRIMTDSVLIMEYYIMQIQYSEKESDAIVTYLSKQVYSFVEKTGYKKVVLGLSGGIDSALVLSIAMDALGVENVHALFMPSQYTTNESKQCIREISTLFDISIELLPIHSLIQTYMEEYETSLGMTIKGLALENLQARIRANLLMTYSNMNNALLLSTSNKSELAVGFCTLYGDTCGAIAPIGDIYKTNVYMLAKRSSVVYARTIPEIVFTKKPSAELAHDQYDEDRLPPYSILDRVLYVMEHNKEQELEEEMVEYKQDIEELCKKAEFKKSFYPPIIRIESIENFDIYLVERK